VFQVGAANGLIRGARGGTGTGVTQLAQRRSRHETSPVAPIGTTQDLTLFMTLFTSLLPVTEIERELMGDIVTLFDEQGLTREQPLSLLGQVSVLIDLVKRGQAQRRSQ
jgi:hypothetical protein